MQMIRAELTGISRCSANGVIATGHAPVLQLCRQLIAAGYDPVVSMEVYRGATLALKVRSIGEGAKLTVEERDRQSPRFGKWVPDQRDHRRTIDVASPVEQN